MFAGRCHHQDWVSGEYIIQPNSWGWGRGLGAGQGAGDSGHRFSPLPAPRREGTETPPSPQKRGGGVEDAACKTTRARSWPALQRAAALGFCSPGVLLLQSGGLWSANPKLLWARTPFFRVPPALRAWPEVGTRAGSRGRDSPHGRGWLQSNGEKWGRKAQRLGPTALDEVLRPCRPPVPTLRAEPPAFGGGTGGEQGARPSLWC